MRRNRRAGLLMRLTSAAAVSAVGLSLAAAPTAAIAQAGGQTPVRPVTNSSSGFARTVQHLMDQARREAAAGNLDAAIQTALRARKIAEAASTTLGASPDCSPEAAEALYRELLAQQPAAAAARPVVASSAPPKSPVISAAAAARPAVASDKERWRSPSPRLKTAPRLDSDATRSERPAGKPVVLKRSILSEAPVATELGLRASLDIVGGDGSRNEAVPLRTLPFDEPAVAMIAANVPPSVPTVATATSDVETPAEPFQRATAAPTILPQPRRMDVSEWSSVGAVAPRQRLARVENLRTDGWQSPSDQAQTVTTAVAVSERTEPSTDAVSPTAYHRKPDAAPLTDATPIVGKEPVAVPAPPMELDEIDVALRSPSVWVRDTTPVLAPAAPHRDEPSTVWQSFSKWTKQRGWTATSAALGFAAAVLAVMACIVALIPRRNEQA